MALAAVKFDNTMLKVARAGASGTGMLLNADTLNMALSTGASATPLVGDIAPFTTATQVANGNGYATNGVTLTAALGVTGSGPQTINLKTTANFASPTWTASGAGFNFRYLIFYDSTTSTADTQNILNWDYGASQALSGANSDTFDISGSNFNTKYATIV